jgi:hypothetical protein
LQKWCETNYQGNTSQPMLQTEGKKQVISEFQDCGNPPREMREEKERTKGKWENVDPVSRWYKRHAGGSRYPAAFETGYLPAWSWIPGQARK